MIARSSRHAALFLCAALVGGGAVGAARDRSAVRPATPLSERELVERGLVMVRLDPKAGAAPDECDDLAVSDLTVTVGRRPAVVKAVERVPRPLRHWLLLDTSESAEERRSEAQRSAAQYAREVMDPGVDVASVLTVDEDPILVAGPTDDPSRLAQDIESVEPGGWSALRDGLDQILRQVEGDRHEQLILYWTDGEDQSSLVNADELFATLARAPNATVFPIALLPSGAKFPPPPLTGATFTEIARRSGGEVFVSSDPRWLDRVRGWIGRRFTIAFAPPEEASDGHASRRGLEIAVRGKRCQVTRLADPFARPDPVAGAAPPAPGSWLRLHAGSRVDDDPACATEREATDWDWPLRAEDGGLTGCMLDLARSPGPFVNQRDGARRFDFQTARFTSREIHVLAPDLARLPGDAAEAVASLVVPGAVDGPSMSRLLMEGNAMLAQRSKIATSLFAARAEYRDFALARLKRDADEELRGLTREFARAFPDLPPDRIEAVARASRAGRRAMEASDRPTDADLVRVLTAWIRDVPAGNLLRELEMRLIDARIRGGGQPALAAAWANARDNFAMPSRMRIVAPLVLIHDKVQDVVGFARIVLPRPERFRRVDSQTPRSEASLDARLPFRPFALELIDALVAAPSTGEGLASKGYRSASIDYRPSDLVKRKDPMQPFARAHVAVTLVAASADGGETRVVLEADVSSAADGFVAILNFAPNVTGDPTLAAALATQPWRRTK